MRFAGADVTNESDGEGFALRHTHALIVSRRQCAIVPQAVRYLIADTPPMAIGAGYSCGETNKNRAIGPLLLQVGLSP